MRNLKNIANHQQSVFDTAANSREQLNGFLKSNYDNFFKEKLAEHAKKASNAQDSYNLRQDMMRTKRNN